jgi:hypothetical protein
MKKIEKLRVKKSFQSADWKLNFENYLTNDVNRLLSTFSEIVRVTLFHFLF